RLFGGDGAQTVYQQLPKADSTQKQLPLAFIFRKYEAQLSGYPIISCSAPSPRSGYYQLQGNYDKSMITNRGKTFYVDAYTGSTLNLSPRILKDARMANTNLSLHIGTWYGLPGKILTFIVCLICTSLPVTGFMIWLNKRKKIKNRRRPGCPNLPAFKAKSF
ncbi:MAG TPA: PepSY-associated TM helix domain-containing protein, partial [Niabella sp.]